MRRDAATASDVTWEHAQIPMIETEIKVRVKDFQSFRRRLEDVHAKLISARHFEDNFALDYLDRRIRAQKSLVRVRITEESSFLTFKGPSRPDGLFKTREELETTVGNGEVALRILERLGLCVGFRYQKYREEYSLSTGRPGEEVHVALDETPIGDYAEFEGTKEGIREIADLIGYHESEFLRDSYYSLYIQSCRQKQEKAGHMVFSPTA